VHRHHPGGALVEQPLVLLLERGRGRPGGGDRDPSGLQRLRHVGRGHVDALDAGHTADHDSERHHRQPGLGDQVVRQVRGAVGNHSGALRCAGHDGTVTDRPPEP
jgi:hypothetical protein